MAQISLLFSIVLLFFLLLMLLRVNLIYKKTANKDFELVVLPGEHHTMGEDYGEHKRFDFFVRNLLGINPPAWSEIKTE